MKLSRVPNKCDDTVNGIEVCIVFNCKIFSTTLWVVLVMPMKRSYDGTDICELRKTMFLYRTAAYPYF